MIIQFLGTSAAVPTKERNLPGIILKFEQTPDWMLFDCGEGTQYQLLHTNYSLPKLSHIFISHLHGDHVFGIFGLLATRNMNNAQNPLTIVGPKGIKKLLNSVFKIVENRFDYKINFYEISSENTDFQIPHAEIKIIPLAHSIPSYAFLIREEEKPGKFNVEKAKSMGISPGPVFGRLKRGEKVELEKGKILDGNDFVEKPVPGRKIIIAGDNSKPEILSPYLKNCNLLVHEATFTNEIKEKIKDDYFHATALQVAKVSERVHLKNFILTHFSARFSNNYSKTENDLKKMREEVESVFSGKFFLANDLDLFQLDMNKILSKINSRKTSDIIAG
ncbi:MAG TPA: ribonuclease Z [Candidatus Cloacimonetes bacterium]|nr:ribonuclease Z [Candidatus Cloacimonadota bacterium]